MITVVYECPRGFVTDLGEPPVVYSTNGHELKLDRYGVWKHNGSKHQVVLVTADFEHAKEVARI